MKLTTLTARSVRGLPRDWRDIEIGDRGIVVFGPNGVGKSSIVDALEYAIRGEASLYPVRRQNVNWDAGSPHVRDGDPEIAVELRNQQTSFQLEPNENIDALPDDFCHWVAVARGASFVLRR